MKTWDVLRLLVLWQWLSGRECCEGESGSEGGRGSRYRDGERMSERLHRKQGGVVVGMPSLSIDINSIDSSNVVSLSGGRHLKPNLTNGGEKKYIYFHLNLSPNSNTRLKCLRAHCAGCCNGSFNFF